MSILLRPIKDYYRKRLNPSPQPLPELLKNLKGNDYYSNSKKGVTEPGQLKIQKFGELNKDKTFYVIKRTPGTGLFSNVVFVLNHLNYAKKLKYIPIVDMKNYITVYNEINKIKKNNNAWEYYFNQTTEFSLDEVYQSHNVIITDNTFYHSFTYDMENIELKNIIKLENLVKKNFIKIANKIKKKTFDKKVIGVHFRGTSYKQSTGHPMPATKIQMKNLVKKIMERDKIDKIFLATEEKDYLDFFLREFKGKVIYFKSAYRSNKNDAFKIYPRAKHRYKLGRESLLEAILLSECDNMIYVNSNITSAAIAFNLNKNQKRFLIDNGYNSKKVIHSLYKWYLKKILPEFLGGFKKNLI